MSCGICTEEYKQPVTCCINGDIYCFEHLRAWLIREHSTFTCPGCRAQVDAIFISGDLWKDSDGPREPLIKAIKKTMAEVNRRRRDESSSDEDEMTIEEALGTNNEELVIYAMHDSFAYVIDPDKNWRIIHEAAKRNWHALLRRIIENAPEEMYEATKSLRLTPLHVACKYRKEDAMRVLEENHAPQIQDRAGNLPRDYVF